LARLQELKSARSGCPIATSLDLFGDRWTLVILRDLAMGKSRFGEFLSSPEKIPTNILAARLSRLESSGLIEKHAYQNNPARFEYALTARGADLLPVMQAICKWANMHFPQTWRIPDRFRSMTPADILANRPVRKA